MQLNLAHKMYDNTLKYTSIAKCTKIADMYKMSEMNVKDPKYINLHEWYKNEPQNIKHQIFHKTVPKSD